MSLHTKLIIKMAFIRDNSTKNIIRMQRKHLFASRTIQFSISNEFRDQPHYTKKWFMLRTQTHFFIQKLSSNIFNFV